MKYAYESSWKRYAYPEESRRFLSREEEDLLKICDRIDLRKRKRKKGSGGIPIHYRDETLWVLKDELHTRVVGYSGSKKSRTVCRGKVISVSWNGDSFIIHDPKGEIYSDPKIQYFLKKMGVEVHVVDFREFNKDGFNCLGNIADLKRQGKDEKAEDAINRFGGMLAARRKVNDDFWKFMPQILIQSAMKFTLDTLAEKDELDRYHLATLKNFISQDQEQMRERMKIISAQARYSDSYHPLREYCKVLENPDRTYACIVSSADGMLSDFCSSQEALKMLCTKTFEIRDCYRKPMGIFLVIPDETSAYDGVAGYLFDLMYQILIDEYETHYQSRKEAPCNVAFICDEAGNIAIPDMGSKISASRSRQIGWTLIYQSEKQMESTYEREYGTICGNCNHYLFLGSSDQELLEQISRQAGTTQITEKENGEPLVSVDALRRMKKERDRKDALLMSGDLLYCAKLPDYGVFPFLKEIPPVQWKNRIADKKLRAYTPEELEKDCLQWDRKGKRVKKKKKAVKEEGNAQAIFDIERELQKIFEESDNKEDESDEWNDD